jgi:hypothetical protein
MNKRYRLLKDLPDCKAGTVLEQENPYGLFMYCGAFDGKEPDSWYIKDVVENNPEWFELIEEPQPKKERVEVNSLNLHDRFLGNTADTYWYQFCASKPLDGTKFPLITKAIEQILNDEKPVWWVSWDEYNTLYGNYYDMGLKYDKLLKEVDEIKRRAFDGGRYHYLNPDFHFGYPTFESYKQSKQKT